MDQANLVSKSRQWDDLSMENQLIQTEPSHVAILVPSARKAAEFLRQFDFQIGPEEKWEGELSLASKVIKLKNFLG